MPILKDWDNGGWAEFSPPDNLKIDSLATCRSACETSDRCLQFRWSGLDAKECLLMFQIRYGQARKPETLQGPEPKEGDAESKGKEKMIDYTSGWITERITRWREERSCPVVQWVGPSITRIY